ncbi:hypothetical protein UB33_11030 [Photobacterium angustum]|uniref:hypothetical protein n=1 Tax=Photobacterium angustum TaxID=661 RepID=UPI0005E1C6BA|nr:hypothetical protein [Photobacterium angustum]KJG05892.1 hypothetical protein UB33_11030 [Photobacterium angustum]PSV92616.1 hypothetical protein CTN01_12380 [Photobacterium angustum]
MDIEKYNPSVEPVEDKIHRLIRSIIGVVPVGSGTVLEAFNVIWQDPAQKRAEIWMEAITNSLIELQSRHEILISNLHSNEEFLSIFAHANQIVLRTHETEKREHLKNSVMNSLVNEQLTYDLKHSFFQLLDRLTLSHIMVLKALSDGVIWGSSKDTTESRYPYFVSKVLIKKFPSFVGNHSFLEQIVRELSDNRFIHDIKLIKIPGQNEVNSGSHKNTDSTVIGLTIPVDELTEFEHNYQTRMTVFGFQFLEFIENGWEQA